MTTLATLIEDARSLGEAAFVARYPAPLLLLEQSDPGPDSSAPKPERFPDELAGAEEERPSSPVLAWLRKEGCDEPAVLVALGSGRDSDIQVPLASLSKTHAIFMEVGAEWRVAHQGSPNGLRLNGEAIPGGVFATLEDEDQLTFGPELLGAFFSPEGLYAALSETGTEHEPEAAAAAWRRLEGEREAARMQTWIRARTRYLAFSYSLDQEPGQEFIWVKARAPGRFPRVFAGDALDESIAREHCEAALVQMVERLESQSMLDGGELLDFDSVEGRAWYQEQFAPVWAWAVDPSQAGAKQAVSIALDALYLWDEED